MSVLLSIGSCNMYTGIVLFKLKDVYQTFDSLLFSRQKHGLDASVLALILLNNNIRMSSISRVSVFLFGYIFGYVLSV